MSEKSQQPWLQEPSLQELLRILNSGDDEARIAGGAVRNALLGEPINDIDVATTLEPSGVIKRIEEAGYKSIPTGIDHGTVTAVLGNKAYEVTTLREDVKTNGRHAQVLFGKNWEKDAHRRDLTMNALYMDADGTIFDPLGGMEDVLSQNVRFIDDAEKRIREDYLRILRFFRFFAWYGKFRPDAEGLKACTRLKNGIDDLSSERIWHELAKLLAAPDPGRALLWMRQTGVLDVVLPESRKWGIDALPALVRAEQENNWKPDALLRLISILPPLPEKLDKLASRLKLSNKVRDRLIAWAGTPEPNPALKKGAFYQKLYWQDEQAVEDRLRLAVARNDENAKKFLRQLKWAGRWERPEFPVRGQDLLNLGMKPGPQISVKLQKMEKNWVDSNFELSCQDMLDTYAKET